MNDQKRSEFLAKAVRALHGQSAFDLMIRVADAIELAYRQGASDGFNLRVEDELTSDAGKYNFKSEEVRAAHDLTY